MRFCILIAFYQAVQSSAFSISQNHASLSSSKRSASARIRMPFQLSVSTEDDMMNMDMEYNMEEDDMDTSDASRQLKPIRRLKRSKKIPLIAIVGRPNVGKSALVNRIAGTQSGGAIVADESGITRDRTYRNAEFLGENFQLVDTGGLVFDDNDALFAREIREQAMIAIDEAVGVILVVDGMCGLTNMDQELADFLRKQVTKEIPVHVAVNKCESEKTGAVAAAEFWSLGLGEPFPVSALHGVGTAELLEQMFESIDKKGSAIQGFGTKAKKLAEVKLRLKSRSKKNLPGETDDEAFMRKYGVGKTAASVVQEYEDALAAFDEEEAPDEIAVAIIGRPNVGKSSLLNALFGSTRAIVSDMAGTTRDSIDAIMERPPPDGSDEPPTIYRFIDTAGIRRKSKIDFGPEFFMVNRALRAIRRADVVLLILDATAGVTEQDRILAQKVADDGRSCVLVVNKWDAVANKDSNTFDKSVKYFRGELPQVRWAPIIFTSAATGQRVGKIYGAVDDAVGAHRKRISTAVLNEVLRDATLWQPPPSKRNGSQAKIYYCNQVSTRPPTIVVFCNDPTMIHDGYRRYLDRKFRESLEGFEATPIRWIFRGRRARDVARQRSMNGN
jgi:GTP-binding protein